MSKGNKSRKSPALLQKLQHVHGLLDECIALLKHESSYKSETKQRAKELGGPPKGLPGHLLRLRREDLFKEAKTPKEVHRKLQAVYPCELNRVTMALMRLQRRRQLRKTSKIIDKTKQVAYVW